MSAMARPIRLSILKFLIHEYTVITLILLNTVVLFLDEFPGIKSRTGGILFWIDYACIAYFLLEALLKIGHHGFRNYWRIGWNRFDFLIVLASMPSLIMPASDMHALSAILVLRVGRVIRFFRLLRFVPNINHLIAGVRRALSASIGVFLVLFLLNLSLALGATILFRDLSPEHFGNPLLSAYSLFKVFTIEGWYEIPDALSATNASQTAIHLLRLYFIVSVLVGGMLGVSLANAVFVDEMTADNTQTVETMVTNLHAEMIRFYATRNAEQEERWREIQRQLTDLQVKVAELKNPPGGKT